MKIEIEGTWVVRDGVRVGAVWFDSAFKGCWYSRVFAESPEIGSRMFHKQENATRDALKRAAALTPEQASLKPPGTMIPKLHPPVAFSD